MSIPDLQLPEGYDDVIDFSCDEVLSTPQFTSNRCRYDQYDDGQGESALPTCDHGCTFFDSQHGRTRLRDALEESRDSDMPHYFRMGKGAPYGPHDLYALMCKQYPVMNAKREIHSCVLGDKRVTYHRSTIQYWYGTCSCVEWILITPTV